MIEKVSKKIKFLAAVMGSLLITSVSAFGMYGVDGNDWIGFLTHGNQLRARMDQLGFVLGNGTIKGTFGVKADTGWMGSIINDGGTYNNESVSFNPTLSAGIGYTSDMFGIGVGYNFTYIDRFVQVHTPVVVFNALNNNLRLAVPIQIAVTDTDKYKSRFAPGWYPESKAKFTGIGFNQIELRYYTGIDAFNLIRVDASYKNLTIESGEGANALKGVYEDLALQLRLYFLNTQIGNVTVNPFLRIDYSTVLKGNADNSGYGTIANKYAGWLDNDNNYVNIYEEDSGSIYDVKPYTIKITPVLSLAASSDIVSLYFEPSLGYKYLYYKYSADYAKAPNKESITHALTWGAYAEMYVTPVKDLEWYFEMDVNGNVTGGRSGKAANTDLAPVLFETTTGITWYLPSLGGDTAQ